MSTSPTVRRCKACGEAAVLAGLTTLHRSLDIHGDLFTQSHRCQACGRRFLLCSWPLRAGIFFAGVLLTPLLLGLPLLWLGWWLGKQDGWNPIVPGAAPPPVRYRNGPRLRTCSACGGTCHVRATTQRLVGVLPAGRDMFYTCDACNAQFQVESLFGLAVTTLGGVLVLASGAIMGLDGAGQPGPILLALVLVMGGLFAFSWVASGFRLRLRNPVRSDDLLP